ncbi:PP2C family protein-serine/threonine phosphatase [Streptomyces nanshensis]|uniref:Protein phosphatase n=1 Tax=Streptomyces nanshensis TaxID=518642 RepID=A0A1E7KS13_9ACTN|nr:PP2C family protein-serine/threonine phosphatase [Streptomyces nanshensis]OEV06633.1 protein phosphatase [Streptomyces nanshensis]
MSLRFADLRRSLRESSWMLAVPLAWLVVIVVADVLAPPHIHLGPLLVAAPAITASFAGAWATGFVAVLAVAAQTLIAVLRDKRELFSSNHEAQIAALVVVGISLVWYCVLRERRSRELSRVRHVSESAQRLTLRPLPQQIGPLRVASLYLSADADAQIGGDVYGATRTRDSTRLMIGDVRGKGISAAGDAALALGVFRATAAVGRETDLAETAALLDDSVGWNLGDPLAEEQAQEIFITASLLDIPDGERAAASLIVCGHPPPLLLRGGRVTALEPHKPAPPLGLGKTGPAGYHVDAFELAAGDVLVLYTDGITEARDAAGRFYPLTDRISGWADSAPQTLIERLRDDVRTHVGGRLGDDAALIALQREPW